MPRPADRPHVVTRADVMRSGGVERRSALGSEIPYCDECGALLGDDHIDWCALYEDPEGGSSETSGSSGTG